MDGKDRHEIIKEKLDVDLCAGNLVRAHNKIPLSLFRTNFKQQKLNQIV